MLKISRWIWVFLSAGPALSFAADISCPPMPSAVTGVSISDRLAPDDDSTTVEPTEVTTPKWWGDREHFLTINFKNVSKRKALSFSVRLVIGNKIAKLTPSHTSDAFQRKDIAIQPTKELLFPVGSVSEITTLLREQMQFKYIVGFQFNLSDKQDAIANCPKECLYLPMSLEYSYKSTSGKLITKSQTIFAVVAK